MQGFTLAPKAQLHSNHKLPKYVTQVDNDALLWFLWASNAKKQTIHQPSNSSINNNDYPALFPLTEKPHAKSAKTLNAPKKQFNRTGETRLAKSESDTAKTH